MRLEVADDGSDVVEDLFDERHHLQLLDLHEMAATLLSYLDERVASHVLDTVVGLCGSECVCVCEEREGRGEVRGRREGEGVDGNIYIGSNCPTMYGSLDGLISLDISHDFTTS